MYLDSLVDYRTTSTWLSTFRSWFLFNLAISTDLGDSLAGDLGSHGFCLHSLSVLCLLVSFASPQTTKSEVAECMTLMWGGKTHCLSQERPEWLHPALGGGTGELHVDCNRWLELERWTVCLFMNTTHVTSILKTITFCSLVLHLIFRAP